MSFQSDPFWFSRYEASPKGAFPQKEYTYWNFESLGRLVGAPALAKVLPGTREGPGQGGSGKRVVEGLVSELN